MIGYIRHILSKKEMNVVNSQIQKMLKLGAFQGVDINAMSIVCTGKYLWRQNDKKCIVCVGTNLKQAWTVCVFIKTICLQMHVNACK